MSGLRFGSRRLYVRPRDTIVLTSTAVALLVVTAVLFDGLLNLISGIVIGVGVLVAGRIAAVRGGESRSREERELNRERHA